MAGNKKGFHQRRMATQAAPKDHDHIGLDVMYAGSAFRGLQIQTHSPTHHTLEGILLQAMVDVGMIEGLSRGAPSGSCHHFSRSCRTDRGVHAIRNVIAIFIPRERCVALGGVEGIHAKLNKALPSAVRVATVFMLTGGFIPRHCCNRRVYRYLLPAYALMPPADSWAAMLEAYPDLPKALMPLAHQRSQQWASEAEDPRRCGIALTESDASWGPQLLPWVHALRQSVERCNDVLRTFVVGAHRFHNFSVDARELSNGAKVVHPDSDEALRVIHRCEVVGRVWMLPVARHGPSLVEYSANKSVDGAPPGLASFTAPPSVPAELDHLPFLMMQIEGNSFLFNMIRKVVGSMLAVCRGARPALLEEALSPERRVLTPLAPGGYLYLAQSTYHGYDRTVLGMRNERFRTLQDARSGAVATAAERFAWEVIAADVVDLDVHQLPPLDFMLAARDAAQKVRRPQSEKEDAHLATMKEYRPISLEKVATTACSDMTIFLRLLRVHNWGITTIHLAPNSKALLEAKNVERRRAAAAEAEADDTQQAAPVEAVADSVNREMPEGGADGWVYVGASVAEEEAMCEAFFRARWKRSRPWEHTTASADDSCAPATSAAKGE